MVGGFPWMAFHGDERSIVSQPGQHQKMLGLTRSRFHRLAAFLEPFLAFSP